jgi:hypothetical protein
MTAIGAVLDGALPPIAVGERAADAPPQVLAALGVRQNTLISKPLRPSERPP